MQGKIVEWEFERLALANERQTSNGPAVGGLISSVNVFRVCGQLCIGNN